MSKPKILFIGAFPPKKRNIFGGNVSACRALLNSSFSTRFELDLLDSTQISNLPPGILTRLILAIKRIVIFLIKIERNKPEGILLFSASGASLFEKGTMAWYAYLRGIPAFLFFRGSSMMLQCKQSYITRMCVRYTVSGARKFLCQGKVGQDFAVEVCGFDRSDAPIVQNWTATEELIEVGSKRILRKADQLIHLLFVGWLVQAKGIFELLESYNEVLVRNNTIHLHIVGEGNASSKARELCRLYGIEKSVTFHGWLQGEYLLNVFRKSDIFVLPSHHEGLPNAMIEAMAAKMAIIVSSVGNIPDVIQPMENGLIVPPKDTSALTKAISLLLEDKALRIKISENAFSTACDNFTAEIAAKKLADIVNSVLSQESATTQGKGAANE